MSSSDERYCLIEGLDAVGQSNDGGEPPWAPGRREEAAYVEHVGASEVKAWCMAEVDIFQDLSEAEMDAIGAAAPMKTYAAGDLLYSPHNPVETLFILKSGRVRVFRVSSDGRALTTAIITPGTIFGEMVMLGQHMYDNFAEAMEQTIVCVMSSADVHRFLLADPRIAARITEILGRRLAGTSRETTTKVLGDFAERGLIRLGRGRITVLDLNRVVSESGD